MAFAVSFQQLSRRIYVGVVDRTGHTFTKKEDLTNTTVAAVAEYVHDVFPDGMTLRGPDGSGWEIDVKPLAPTGL